MTMPSYVTDKDIKEAISKAQKRLWINGINLKKGETVRFGMKVLCELDIKELIKKRKNII